MPYLDAGRLKSALHCSGNAGFAIVAVAVCLKESTDEVCENIAIGVAYGAERWKGPPRTEARRQHHRKRRRSRPVSAGMVVWTSEHMARAHTSSLERYIVDNKRMLLALLSFCEVE